jgi:Ras-related protein Rab-1A
MQFAENKFTENYLTTIGVDFRYRLHTRSFKTVKIDGKSIKFQIWDTAGQERFRTITSSYYRGADGIIIVYDVTDLTSFQDIERVWVPEADNYSEKGTDVLILGNKSDCERSFPIEVIQLAIQKVKSYVKNKNYDFEEVSARTADKVEQTIKNFGKKIADKKFKKSKNG